MANLKIELVKSLNGRLEKAHCNCQFSWACARSVRQTVQPDNAQTRGKIAQIGYLLQVTEEQ